MIDKQRRILFMGAAAIALVATTPLQAPAYDGPKILSLIGTHYTLRDAQFRAGNDSEGDRNALVVRASSVFAQRGNVRELAGKYRAMAMELYDNKGIEIISIQFVEDPRQTDHFRTFPYHNGILPIPYRDGVHFDKDAIVDAIVRSQDIV